MSDRWKIITINCSYFFHHWKIKQ